MFVAVVEEGSVHRAADKVCRTQPAVSIALKKLATEVGSPLFDRKHRFDYQLTPTGEILYSYATRLLALRNETITALRDLSHLRRGAVCIGANESTSVDLLPKLIRDFHEKYPEITIELTCGHSDELVAELQARRLDLALLAHLPEDHNVEARVITNDELVVIVSPRHRLAHAGHIRIKELEDESIITEGSPSPLHAEVMEVFNSHEIPLNVQVKSATIETVKQMVANDIGIGFVPLMCVEHEVARKELIVVPIEDLHLKRSLWLAWPSGDVHSHAALAFIKVVNSLTKTLQQSSTNVSSRTRVANIDDLKTRRGNSRLATISR